VEPHDIALVRLACKGLPGLVILAAFLGCRGHEVPAEVDAAAEWEHPAVRVEAAQRRAISQEVQGLGYCEGLPAKTATLTAAVEGRVVKILVEPGSKVTAGDPIVELDPAVAAANLAEKTSTRDALQAGLALLQALPRPEEQKNFQLAVDAARLAVEKVQSVAERLRPLRDRGEVSAQQMFETELAVKQARVQEETAETQFKVAMLGPRREAVEEAKARIASAEAAEATAKAQLDLHTIRAPIGGVVDGLTCRLGQTLAVGTSIGEVVDLSEVYAQVWLPAPDTCLVRPGQTAQVRVGDHQKDQAGPSPLAAETLAGRVVFVGRVVDPQTGNLPVRILVASPQGRLALGQTLAATITVAEKTGVLAVPLEALVDVGEGPVLNVVRQGKSAVLHPPLGARDKHWVEVAGTDLHVGEPVVVEGGYNLPEGTEVNVEPAGAEPDPAAGEPSAGKSP